MNLANPDSVIGGETSKGVVMFNSKRYLVKICSPNST